MKNLIIIPARKNSKRIINKNLKKIGNTHLIEFSFLFAEKLKQSLKRFYDIDIFFSSDSPKLKSISKQYNYINYINRPSHLSDDFTSNFDVCSDLISNIKTEYACLLLLQPTSPFRNISTLKKAIFYYFNNSNKSIFSVSEVYNNHYYFSLVGKKRIFYKDNPLTFKVNGNFYISSPSLIKKNNSFISKSSIHFITNNDYESIDIDTHKDLILARKIYEINKKKLF